MYSDINNHNSYIASCETYLFLKTPCLCRLFHYPALYKLVHKTHHEWTAPVGIASIYCHPLEHYFVNLLPVAAGPLIVGAHMSVSLLWFTLVIISTTINHSGYHFPFLPSSEWHDFHHARYVIGKPLNKDTEGGTILCP